MFRTIKHIKILCDSQIFVYFNVLLCHVLSSLPVAPVRDNNPPRLYHQITPDDPSREIRT